MPFQSTVNVQPALAVAGDFASANPWASLLSGAGKFVAGAAGVTEGLFAWIDPTDDHLLNNFGGGKPAGFIHREFRQQITAYLAEYGGLVQPGSEVGAMVYGDFWVKNTGAGAVTRGMKAYADPVTGAISFNAAGTVVAGASFTGVIAAGVLTTSAVTGTIKVGSYISGTGVDTPTYIGAQLTGTPGGAGTYSVVGDQTASSTAMTSQGATETDWYAGSAGATLELIKMTKLGV